MINSLDDRPSLTTYRYEFPGDKNVTQNELVIVDVIGRTVKKTDISKWPDQYINPLCVTKDSKYLFLNVRNVHGTKWICVLSTSLQWR